MFYNNNYNYLYLTRYRYYRDNKKNKDYRWAWTFGTNPYPEGAFNGEILLLYYFMFIK